MNHGDYAFTRRLTEFRNHKMPIGFRIQSKEDLIKACGFAHTYDTYRETLVLLAQECERVSELNRYEISMRSKIAWGKEHGYERKRILRHLRLLIIDGLIKEIAPKRFLFNLENIERQSQTDIPASLLIISK